MIWYLLSVFILMILFSYCISKNLEKNVMDTDTGWGIIAGYIAIAVWPISLGFMIVLILFEILVRLGKCIFAIVRKIITCMV